MVERPLKLSAIKARRDFLALRGRKGVSTPGFLLLARENGENGCDIRFGITVTKKLGNAVKRNRIKRRLRAVCRQILPEHAPPGRDLVLIARQAAYDRNFEALLDDMKGALLRLPQHPK
ncbi:MAG: ribonuclease P protein component [Marinicaulis sp.]|nr:ribonuclease P protein component [Marinicaulis sp.]